MSAYYSSLERVVHHCCWGYFFLRALSRILPLLGSRRVAGHQAVAACCQALVRNTQNTLILAPFSVCPEKQRREGLPLLLSIWGSDHFSHEGQDSHYSSISLKMHWSCSDDFAHFFCMWRGSVLLRSFFKFFVISGVQLQLSIAQGQVELGGNGGAVALPSSPDTTMVRSQRQPLIHPVLWNPGQVVTLVPENLFISVCVLQSSCVIKLWWGRAGASFKPAFSSSHQGEWMEIKKGWMLNLSFACLNQGGC